MSVDLSKYLRPQKKSYNDIYMAMMDRKYDSGWIEFILPRLESQTDSKRSYGMGLNDEKEIKAFWKNKYLHSNYVAMVKLLSKYSKEEYLSTITERGRFKIKQSIEIFLPYANEEEKMYLEGVLNFYKE